MGEKADNVATFMCRMSWKSGSLNLLEPSGPHRAYYETPLLFTFYVTSTLAHVRRVVAGELQEIMLNSV